MDMGYGVCRSFAGFVGDLCGAGSGGVMVSW